MQRTQCRDKKSKRRYETQQSYLLSYHNKKQQPTRTKHSTERPDQSRSHARLVHYHRPTFVRLDMCFEIMRSRA